MAFWVYLLRCADGFLKRRMKPAQPVADGRTRFLSVHGAARVDAVAEQRIAQAPLRVLVFDYEFVEVLSHPVPLSAHPQH